MNLATRCTACGTVFRVVQDQLKVSEGWVRCGRCGEVFNAAAGLFDLDREGPPNWQAPVETGTGELGTSLSGHAPLDAARPTTDSSGRDTGPTASGAPPRASSSLDDGVDLMLDLSDGTASSAQSSPVASRSEGSFGARPSADHEPHRDPFGPREDSGFNGSVPSSLSPSTTGAVSSTGGFADARFNTRLLADDEASAAAVPQATPDEASPLSRTPESVFDGPSPDEAPAKAAFVMQAERAARWRRPGVRAALGTSALGLAILLAAQIGVHFRDTLAAAAPALREPIEALCNVAGCRVTAPMRIDALSVDSSTIAQASNGTGYKLTVTLRNRAAHAVATPALDLTLTDANGQPIARRVIAASDFGAQAAVLKASAETPLQVWLSAGGAPVAGYTIELFYP